MQGFLEFMFIGQIGNLTCKHAIWYYTQHMHDYIEDSTECNAFCVYIV